MVVGFSWYLGSNNSCLKGNDPMLSIRVETMALGNLTEIKVSKSGHWIVSELRGHFGGRILLTA